VATIQRLRLVFRALLTIRGQRKSFGDPNNSAHRMVNSAEAEQTALCYGVISDASQDDRLLKQNAMSGLLVVMVVRDYAVLTVARQHLDDRLSGRSRADRRSPKNLEKPLDS
jgi:hypothetical protein